MADFRKGATGDIQNVLFQNFAGGKDIELDAAADSASYTAGTLTFSNINILYPSDLDANVCSNVESINQIFDDKTDPVQSSFESDATSFAEIVSEKKEGNGIDESKLSWTFYARYK